MGRLGACAEEREGPPPAHCAPLRGRIQDRVSVFARPVRGWPGAAPQRAPRPSRAAMRRIVVAVRLAPQFIAALSVFRGGLPGPGTETVRSSWIRTRRAAAATKRDRARGTGHEG